MEKLYIHKHKKKVELLFFLLIIFCFYPNTVSAETKFKFPDEIYIKTRTETFNSRAFFILKDGKIWQKKRLEKDQWHIMPNNGLPYSLIEIGFPKPEKITEIHADGDELVAIDNKGRFYIMMVTKFIRHHDIWHYNDGFPKEPLQYNEITKTNRALSMGRRHFDVLWYDDPFGNQHHYGTMGTSTFYLLSSDGHKIMFTDNGLPADFSHRICGPHRGRFIAENLQASAGTIFLINSEGNMFTKMEDFDINGGTSMFFKYTYKPYKSDIPGYDFKSAITPIGLPPKEWQQQPEIKLKNKARITKKITILQNGHGNSARELRVAGLDFNGNSGYYYKQIFAKNWLFKKTNINLDKNDFLNTETHKKEDIWNEDLKYTGFVTLSNGDRYNAEFTDFNLECSPASLLINLGDKNAKIKFHTVEAWTYLKRVDPGRDGTPKIFLGTFDIDKSQLNLLPKELKDLNLKTFAFSVSATLNNIFIKSQTDNHKISMDFGVAGQMPKYLQSKLKVGVVYKNKYVFVSDLKNIARNLKIPDYLLKKDLNKAEISKLNKEINNLNEVKNIFDKFLSTQKEIIKQHQQIIFFYGMVEKGINILNIEKIMIASDKGTSIVKAYYDAEKSEYFNAKDELEKKRDEIKNFIWEAQKKLLLYNIKSKVKL